MGRILSLVELVAPDDVSVLLIGETGVGKDVMAERIHRRSNRRNGPFVRLNAAAVTPSLFEAELFGYERGAFTGAVQRHVGYVEQSHGGTLFVDEVGDLPAETQVKLLRVLEDRRIRRVGGTGDIDVDLRIVAATHRDLEQEVVAGRFRQDLYFRLNGFTLRIPSLRDRLDEVPQLANALLASWAAPRGLVVPTVSEAAMALLRQHCWPGNVRELRSVLHQAALLCDGRCIKVEDLPVDEMAGRARLMGPGASEPIRSTPAVRLVDSANAEPRAIEAALAQAGGNQTRAAEFLGMSRRSLIRRLDRYGLARPRK